MTASRPTVERLGSTPDSLLRTTHLSPLWRARLGAWTTSRLVTAYLIALSLIYFGGFVYLEWLRYDTFLMHALDMGNMEQAVWNTAHGHPFAFNNLRFHNQIEASGTTTRLSFHVEPILLLISLIYFFHAGPDNLIVVQTAVLATGVFPVAWLARRYLHSTLAQLVFPLIYLFTPALEAANLYEFHAVTLSAALLLWAFYFADGRRYGLFALFAVLAMFTKEEIGLVVGMMGLWIWWRQRTMPVGLTTLIVAVGWSLFCLLIIMPGNNHYQSSSPYCARYNPYVINGHGADSSNGTNSLANVHSCIGVLKIWVEHPDQVLSVVTMPQKLGFLHRYLMPAGYLSLLNPFVLLISLPSLAVILFSNDQHMYSGLGHYSAELVPIMIVAAITGIAWLSRRLSTWQPRLSFTMISTVLMLWALIASLANQRTNGFTPIAEAFSLPQETYHDQVAHQMLGLIPRDASVSAGDFFNAHLSDRANIYLFPDVGSAQYAIVDITRDQFPINPADEYGWVQTMLAGTSPIYGNWGIVAAKDGIILLEQLKYAPNLPKTLPDSFYTFAVSQSVPQISHPMVVNYGPLQLLGYDIDRREQVNLRQPDVLMTLYFKVTAPLTATETPAIYLTNGSGAIDYVMVNHPALLWVPTSRWTVGSIITLRTVSMSIATIENGLIDIDLAMYRPGSCALSPQLGCDPLGDLDKRLRPDVRQTSNGQPLETVWNGTLLKLAQVRAIW